MTPGIEPTPKPTIKSWAMNMWTPARDQATAERLYRLVEKFATQGLTLQSFVNQGWTIAGMIEHGFAEAIPAEPIDPHTLTMLTNYGNASSVTTEIVDSILSRDAHGQKKYGVSLDRPDLSVQQWLQHMCEELMDGAHYALAAKREYRRELIDVAAEAAANVLREFDGTNELREGLEVGVRRMLTAIRTELSK